MNHRGEHLGKNGSRTSASANGVPSAKITATMATLGTVSLTITRVPGLTAAARTARKTTTGWAGEVANLIDTIGKLSAEEIREGRRRATLPD